MTLPEDKRAAAAQGMLHAWWAARIPDRLAVISPHGDRTYEDLNHEINRLGRALRARGLEPGDAIALMCTNRPEFLEVLYAAQRIGLRLTPINWHLTGEEASYIIENCGAKAFICSGELGERVTTAAEGGGPGLIKINTGGYLPGFEMYNAMVAEEDGSDIEDPVIGTQMLYTSGTTGRPKGVHRATAATSALANVNFSADTTRTGRRAPTPTSSPAPSITRRPWPSRSQSPSSTGCRSCSWTIGTPQKRCG